MTTLGEALDEALDAQGAEPGTVEARHGGAAATAEVEASGPIGVRLRRLRVERDRPADIAEEAAALPERLAGCLPERVVPVEVDPRLGGAVLRTDPEELGEEGFTEIEVGPEHSTVQRLRPDLEGGRTSHSWDLTRRDLRGLVDGLRGSS